jgi:hypothetical protein
MGLTAGAATALAFEPWAPEKSGGHAPVLCLAHFKLASANYSSKNNKSV